MIADLMDKIGRNVPLTSIELNELRNEFRSMDEVKNLVKGWVQAGTSNPIFVPPMQVIYSKVLEADTASLTINIPSVYKHLMIMGSGRINGSGGQLAVFTMCQFNGDTTAENYQWAHFGQSSEVPFAKHDTSYPSTIFWHFVAEGEATNSFVGSAVIFIPHYRSSWYKILLTIEGISLTAGTSTAARHGLWKSTSPIESITIFPEPTYASAKIVAGTSISVYGIL